MKIVVIQKIFFRKFFFGSGVLKYLGSPFLYVQGRTWINGVDFLDGS